MVNLEKDQITLQNFAAATQFEWLETNGLGGYASSTLTGTNTRRYHGLLIAASKPPLGRISLLAKSDETIICGDERFELGCNQYNGVVSPQGYMFLKSFSQGLFPEFTYELPNGIIIKKTIAAVNGENTTLIIYEVITSPVRSSIELLPLVSGRDFNSLTHVNEAISRVADFENSVLKIKPYTGLPELFISFPGAVFSAQPGWYYNFEYLAELSRGEEFTEDLFNYGKLNKELTAGEKFGIIISTENPGEKNVFDLFSKEKARREKLSISISGPGSNNGFPPGYNARGLAGRLVLAADQFIVKHDALKSIIAGYHWFSEWGRDAMISLPGLCLATGRYKEAKEILAQFAKHMSQGLVPNRFPEYGAPEFNTADATLWFFIAIHKYFESTGDKEFVLQEMLPLLKDSIDWHFKGTLYNIHVADDGLLYQGIPGQQLTWMDARIGDWEVTPRIGKAVEINSLWYNVLMIFSELLKINGESEDAAIYFNHAVRVKESFARVFWNEEMKCLFDFVNGDFKDASIRPNQLFALSLPYPLVNDDKAVSILNIVKDKLFTPVGLRSLSRDHPDYKGRYEGNQMYRDMAYHQGTVWSWLLGVYIEAVIKVKGKAGKKEAEVVMMNFLYHLEEGCIGSISEIFDGDDPHIPRGCIAQAWSAGEILRVFLEFQLFDVREAVKEEIIFEV